MRFDVCGPFELYRTHKGLIDNDRVAKREFWDHVDDHVPGLSDACGCYVFAIQSSRGTLPWYVGKAEKTPFWKECLTSHKLKHYDNAIAGRRGRPVLLFLPQLTKQDGFRKPTISKRLAIEELETILIGMAVSRNPAILNIKGTRMARNLVVEGFMNSGRKAKGGPAGELRKVFQL